MSVLLTKISRAPHFVLSKNILNPDTEVTVHTEYFPQRFVVVSIGRDLILHDLETV